MIAYSRIFFFLPLDEQLEIIHLASKLPFFYNFRVRPCMMFSGTRHVQSYFQLLTVLFLFGPRLLFFSLLFYCLERKFKIFRLMLKIGVPSHLNSLNSKKMWNTSKKSRNLIWRTKMRMNQLHKLLKYLQILK